MSLQFRDKDVVQDSVERFAQVQVDDVYCSTPVHQFRSPIIEGHQTGQAGFPLTEAMLAVTNHLVVDYKSLPSSTVKGEPQSRPQSR